MQDADDAIPVSVLILEKLKPKQPVHVVICLGPTPLKDQTREK